jgi:hypothetical protein
MLSHRLKGKWSLRRRKGFHSTPSNYSSFAVAPQRSPIWYNLHSYLIYQRGRKFEKGLIFHSKDSVFWRLMPKGERVLAQRKRTAPPRQFQNFSKQVSIVKCFLIGIFEISIPLRNSISIGIYILRRSFSKNLVSKIFDLLQLIKPS